MKQINFNANKLKMWQTFIRFTILADSRFKIYQLFVTGFFIQFKVNIKTCVKKLL